MIPFVKPEANELLHSTSACGWGQHTGACSVETQVGAGGESCLP